MKISIGVVFGGRSVEHEISVISAIQAINAVNKEKYTVTPIYISKQGKWYTGDALTNTDNYKNTDALLNRCTQVYLRPELGNNNLYCVKKKLFGTDVLTSLDIIFPILHGTTGEDGSFQGLIELTGIPYVGCNPLASANGMDKITMKMILRESGIPVIDYTWFTDKQWFSTRDKLISEIENKLNYPVIIKPANLGSSVGISRATDRDELIRAVDTAAGYSTRIIAEKMVVDLKEINCAVLGTADEKIPSVCEEPLKSGEILSYQDKYMGGGKGGKTPSKGMQSTQRQIPANLPENMSKKIQSLACETFRVLSCEGVSRIDFIVDKQTDEIYVNEINTIPGSLSFYLWEATGISFDELIDRLIDLSLKRSREQEMKITSYNENIFNITGGYKSGNRGTK
jgi:D-alanine--D-alanine ligase